VRGALSPPEAEATRVGKVRGERNAEGCEQNREGERRRGGGWRERPRLHICWIAELVAQYSRCHSVHEGRVPSVTQLSSVRRGTASTKAMRCSLYVNCNCGSSVHGLDFTACWCDSPIIGMTTRLLRWSERDVHRLTLLSGYNDVEGGVRRWEMRNRPLRHCRGGLSY
jgi:hypothetical protein